MALTYFLAKLPLLASLKVNYKELPAPKLQRERLSSHLVLPRTALEERLLSHWQEIFQEQSIGVKDNFFELGGDSLLAVTLISRIEQDLQYALPAKAVNPLDSIEKLALSVSSRKKSQDPISRSLEQHEYNLLASAIGACTLKPIAQQGLIRVRHPQAKNPPLFWCFNVLSIEPCTLSDVIGPEQPLYALFSGIFAIIPLTDKVSQRIALHYVDEIRRIKPHGPYRLGGNCSGAHIAIKIARELQQQGEIVEKLICMEAFDSLLFDFPSDMLLLYGQESHLHAYKPFAWKQPGWQDQFTRIPQVEWLPGQHGQFFSPENVPTLAAFIADFLAK